MIGYFCLDFLRCRLFRNFVLQYCCVILDSNVLFFLFFVLWSVCISFGCIKSSNALHSTFRVIECTPKILLIAINLDK